MKLKLPKRARMHNRPHPGEVLADTVLGSGGLSVSEFARKLGVSRVALSRVVNGRAAISADMALRLAAALGGSAESWLGMQASYDLWKAAQKKRTKVEPIKLRQRSPASRSHFHFFRACSIALSNALSVRETEIPSATFSTWSRSSSKSESSMRTRASPSKS